MTELFVLGWIGEQQIAFEATSVEAVVDIAMVVSVPLAAEHVVGLAAIRSQVITVIDGSVAAGGRRGAPTGRAIVAAIDGHRYAIRVDRVDDVIAADFHQVSESIPLAKHWRALAAGVIESDGAFVVVIDAARIIAGAAVAIAA